MTILEKLAKSILKVYDKYGKEIGFNDAALSYITNSRRGVAEKYPTLFLDGEICYAKDKKVTYICPTCKREHTILLKRFLTKTSIECRSCKEQNVKKIEKHKEFYRTGKKDGPQKRTEKNFELENEDFKTKYFESHLTKEEFYNIKHKIVSIDGKINDEYSNIEYIEAFPVENQFRYSPCVIINEEKHPLLNVYVECPKCGKIYKISDSRRKKEKLLGETLCKDCVFSNKIFPIEEYVTLFGDKITYQGNSELNFIKNCEEKNIRVVNGPEVPYYWRKKDRIYHIDFELPTEKLLIEIKENHVWHRRQVESGKWEAKEDAAIKFAKANEKEFKLLFNKDITDFFKTL